MTDTIDLLETIGKNASLRHASAKDLERILKQMRASDPLQRAAATGEPGHLKAELHPMENKSVQTPPAPGPGPSPGPSVGAHYPPEKNLTPPPPPEQGL